LGNSTDTDDPLSLGVLVLNQASTLAIYYTAFFLLFIFLLLLSALFSGAETIFAQLSSEDKKTYRRSTQLLSRLITHLTDKPRSLLATLLLANSLVNITIAALAVYGLWYIRQSPLSGALITLLILFTGFIVLFFGEVLPKIYAKENQLFFLRKSAPLIQLSLYLLAPFTAILVHITHYIEQYLHKRGYKISVDELNQVIETNASASTSESEKQFLQGVVNFGTITARQIMRSRLDITALPIELDYHELMDKINKLGYSRIPVYEETIDTIVGLLYIKDLLPYLDQNEDFDWRGFLRPPYFVTENKKIDDLLYDFQVRRVHIAIVVDEYGGTSGLVTMEDIIEEIIGDIQDEFDQEEKPFTQIDANTYVFESKTLLNDFCKYLQIDPATFEDVRGDNESLGGLLLELFARLPQVGEKITYANLSFLILSADNKKIKKIKITTHTPDNSQSDT